MDISLGTTLEAVRASSPLVHNICNYVAAERIADTLLALRCSPLMADASEEMLEISKVAQGLSINIGTLTDPQFSSMKIAIKAIKEQGKPWVLDPVGIGISTFRHRACSYLLEQQPTLIRGNASEILTLSEGQISGRGVDSSSAVSVAHEAAKSLALKAQTIVVVTGVKDFVTDGAVSVEVANGHPLMSSITGTGCALSAVLAAFLTQGKTYHSVLSGLVTYNVAGEIAAAVSSGPGTFQGYFLDALHNISPEEVNNRTRMLSL